MRRRGRAGRFLKKPSAAIVVLAAVVVCACAAWGGCTFLIDSTEHAWIGQSLRSELGVRCGLIVLASLLGLILLSGVMWRLGRAEKSRSTVGPEDRETVGQTPARPLTGEEGTASIEFALLLPVAMFVVLTMAQAMLLMAGNMGVHYASYCAARSAIVQVPAKYSAEEPRNVVSGSDSSFKMNKIKLAAAFAVMPVSAGKPGAGGAPSGGAGASVEAGLVRFYQLYGHNPPNWVANMVAAQCSYAWDFTTVSMEPPVDGIKYGDHEDLTVNVRHTLYLGVPYVNRMFGNDIGGSGDYGTEVAVSTTLTNEGVEDDIDIEQFPRYVGRGGGS